MDLSLKRSKTKDSKKSQPKSASVHHDPCPHNHLFACDYVVTLECWSKPFSPSSCRSAESAVRQERNASILLWVICFLHFPSRSAQKYRLKFEIRIILSLQEFPYLRIIVNPITQVSHYLFERCSKKNIIRW